MKLEERVINLIIIGPFKDLNAFDVNTARDADAVLSSKCKNIEITTLFVYLLEES